MKPRHSVGEGFEFGAVQAILEMAAAEDEVDVFMRDIVFRQIVHHRSERGDPCAGTDKEKLFVDGIGQGENALWSTQRQFAAGFDFIEEIGSACAAFEQDDDELDDITSIWPGCDGIAAPALVGLFVNGQIEGDELAWRE